MDLIDIPKEHLVELVKNFKARIDKARGQNTKACKKYRENHRKDYNANSKRYYDKHKDDPVWWEAKKERERTNRLRRNLLKKILSSGETAYSEDIDAPMTRSTV
jgi:hypothetical protein